MTWASLDLTNADEGFRRRFWSKVDIKGPGECWEWKAYRKPTGYGQFTVTKGCFQTASRVSLALTMPIPPGNAACHTCDNPPCVNPAHLFLGTSADKTNDCITKGRGNRAKGEAAASSKLTEEQVRWARAQDYSIWGAKVRVAAELGVGMHTLQSAVTGVYWSHLDGPLGVWPPNIRTHCKRGHLFTQPGLCKECKATYRERKAAANA